MDNIEYTISRYEALPSNSPVALVVSFLVKDLTTQNSGLMEISLPLSEVSGKTQSEVCSIAFAKLSSENNKFLDFFQKQRESIVGSIFIPS